MSRRLCPPSRAPAVLAGALLSTALIVPGSACRLGVAVDSPPRGDTIQLRAASRCRDLQLRASAGPAGAAAAPAIELVIALNGEVCHREGVPRGATVHGELAALCPEPALAEPGPHQVEVALVSPGCAAKRPLARRRAVCDGPDPD
ncbi:MAG TPA: hypothetical protein VK698_18980 [Kofleriaceae bacterium]|nr:hypothetical protein [Kofleriaceae bacterium]